MGRDFLAAVRPRAPASLRASAYSSAAVSPSVRAFVRRSVRALGFGRLPETMQQFDPNS